MKEIQSIVSSHEKLTSTHSVYKTGLTQFYVTIVCGVESVPPLDEQSPGHEHIVKFVQFMIHTTCNNSFGLTRGTV